MKNKNVAYDFSYLVDVGNWSALNKGYKQLMNSADYSKCESRNIKDYEEADDILLEWLANIYVMMQWKYNIPSKRLNIVLPSALLALFYTPLHETSYAPVC